MDSKFPFGNDFYAHVTFEGGERTFTCPVPWIGTLPGEWECALHEISIQLSEPEGDRVFLCGHFLDATAVGSFRYQLLRNVETNTRKTYEETYVRPRYVRMLGGSQDSLRFFLLDKNCKPLENVEVKAHCVLHFRKKWR